MLLHDLNRPKQILLREPLRKGFFGYTLFAVVFQGALDRGACRHLHDDDDDSKAVSRGREGSGICRDDPLPLP